ncbi:sigma-70 family RNA polymerase sigma factor [Sphaerisporangium sp. TRM90804]|uniref:sigma-70 family RNA polymerase sigma factor n=1 Tax=Sphaerisporangium sp. TRM90804 TaxID=3031113 RepID=UPI002446ACAA|nr:sigma-70 family RNA polymerase sigma factor [Sphaerisporangium sp. TRM90804]MDH2424320.1 sigma-70 family RNA polymerase sigma factor [Sphaerisporangium sp. TRM90804]
METLTGEGSRLEPFRTELTGYCYRMLGSGFEAEDAVQETLVRAWRSLDRYDGRRASLRTWLYSIATNICLDMLRSAQRRAVAVDLGPASSPGADIGEPSAERVLVHPIPDALVLSLDGDPEEVALRRETIRLAFVAALQHLPPRQRAVLILRDVLCWKAEEVAHLLGTTVASVTSALQRARSTLKAVGVTPGEPLRPSDPVQRELLSRYCDAFERHDVTALVALLHEDATMSMPPYTWWLHGRDQIRLALLAPGAACEGARLVPAQANGSPAFWQMRPDGDGGYAPFGLVLLDVAEGLVVGATTFLDADRLIPLFGSPAVPPRSPEPAAPTGP